MKKLILSALALLGMGAMETDVMAQFYVYDENGKVLYQMKEGTPAYIEFEAPKAPSSGTENGHDWVDLGIKSGTLWATCNVGADTPESYGDYYAWGEKATKETYDWSTYFDTEDGGSTFKNYNLNGGKTELDAADDVASQTWGGKWQMPTSKMQYELITQCYWVWTTSYNGKSVDGYTIYKAKKDADKGVRVSTPSPDYNVATDAHIFLPVAGYRSDGKLYRAGDIGFYWSRSLRTNGSIYAYEFTFDAFYVGQDYVGADNYYRCCGRSIRPVCPSQK